MRLSIVSGVTYLTMASASQQEPVNQAIPGRSLLLFNPKVQPQNWNERMDDGEYAVLYTGTRVQPQKSPDDISPSQPFCSVFPSLPAAEAHAREAVQLYSGLRCRIYTSEGLAHQPVLEISGSTYKGESDFTPRFRRLGGSILFFGGILLTVYDWHADFRYTWPSALGTRMVPTGLVLLFIEFVIVVNAVRKQRAEKD